MIDKREGQNTSGERSLGLVQVYTGNGKGKTTAAMGQALRAAGHGFNVVILQFMKGGNGSGEHLFASRYHPFEIIQVARESCFEQSEDERRADAQRALLSASQLVASEDWDMVVLDEILTARNMGLLTTAEVIGVIAAKRDLLELVLTGRNCPEEIVERADLATEMVALKHPYTRGIKARKGVEF